MENSVIRVLRTFTADELERFLLFLNSPIFNSSVKLVKLYEELLKYAPTFDDRSLDYSTLHNSITPHLAFNAITMRRLLFDLEKAALAFLKQQNFENDFVESSENLRSELMARSLEKLFEMNIETVEEILDSSESIESGLFLYKLNLESDKLNLTYSSKKQISKTSYSEMVGSLIRGNNYLTLFFIMKVVKQFLNLQSFQINYGNVNEYSDLKKFLDDFIESINTKRLKELLKKEDDNFYCVFEIYYNLFKAFTDKDDYKYYFRFKQLLSENSKHLKQSEKHFLYMRLLDFCVLKRRKNRNDEVAIKELLELYELVLKKRFYQSDSSSFIHPTMYMNILIFGVTTKKFAWTERFLKIYSDRIHPTFRESMTNFGIARLRFAQKDWSQTLMNISRVNPDMFSLKVDIRNILIMTHYELGNFPTASAMLESYKRFVRRSPMIPKGNKELYKRFAFYVDRLIRLENSRTRVLYSRIRKMLENDRNVIYREWLVEKLGMFDKKRRKAA